jgi:hypothetical protein
MKLNLKNGITSIVVGSAMALSGCGYHTSQESVDRLIQQVTDNWKKNTDRYIEVHQLLKNQQYEKAQTILEVYLRHESKEALETKGALKNTDRISRPTTERIWKTIDEQVEKIDACLK